MPTELAGTILDASTWSATATAPAFPGVMPSCHGLIPLADDLIRTALALDLSDMFTSVAHDDWTTGRVLLRSEQATTRRLGSVLALEALLRTPDALALVAQRLCDDIVRAAVVPCA